MRQSPESGETARTGHLTWVQTRAVLDTEFLASVRSGFFLIAAGFGSFSVFEGLAIGERSSELPKTFALVVTAIGVIAILLGVVHDRKMTAWVDADEFGTWPSVARARGR
jgi:hypothetical protein